MKPSSSEPESFIQQNSGAQERDRLSLSDDDEEFDAYAPPTPIHGTLSKWTNYIHGWQHRYFVLKNGTLSYYRSENDLAFGCRGSVSIAKALIQVREFFCCRGFVMFHIKKYSIRT